MLRCSCLRPSPCCICAGSEAGRVVEVSGVKIVGYRNVPSRIAVDASALYARNLLNFVTLLSAKEGGHTKIDWDDEIVRAVALTRDGSIIHPQFQPQTATN